MMKTTAILLLLSTLCSTQANTEVLDSVPTPQAPSSLEQEKSPHLRGRDQSDRELGVFTARVLIKYANDHGKDDALARSSRLYHDFEQHNVLAIEINDRELKELGNNPHIESIEEDGIFVELGHHERTLTREELEQGHRHLQQSIPYGISMVQANQLRVGSNPVTVCVADTGVARQHPDIPQGLLSGENRRSNISGARLVWRNDSRGHGTHVTGTLTARNNQIGVRGIGKIPVHMTRALDDGGQARESDVLDAIRQCTNSGARVISMSLGGGGMSETFKSLLTDLYDNAGFLLVSASGNNGANSVSWPAAHPRVIAVGAVQEDTSIWPNSNYGSQVELSAPGKMILSTSVNAAGNFVYSYYSGTSMSTPHVAGVAALVWSHFPQCTNTQIRYALTRTALDRGAGGCDDFFGWGIVQARAAFNFLANNPCSGASWGREAQPQGGCT